MLKDFNLLGTVLSHGEIGRILRFVLVGLLNTTFGYFVFLSALWLGVSPAVSVLVANVLGYGFNYFTSGYLVFYKRGLSHLPKFITVAVLVYLANLTLLQLLLVVGVGAELAQLACLPVVVVMNYLSMRLFIYR